MPMSAPADEHVAEEHQAVTGPTDEPVDWRDADTFRPPQLCDMPALVQRQQSIISAPHDEARRLPRAADVRDLCVRADAQRREPLLIQSKLAKTSQLDERGLVGLAGPQRSAAGKLPASDRQDRMSRARRDAQPVAA